MGEFRNIVVKNNEGEVNNEYDPKKGMSGGNFFLLRKDAHVTESDNLVV